MAINISGILQTISNSIIALILFVTLMVAFKVYGVFFPDRPHHVRQEWINILDLQMVMKKFSR